MLKEITYFSGFTGSMWQYVYFIGKIKPLLYSIHLECLHSLAFDTRTTYFRNIFFPFLPIDYGLEPLLMKFTQLLNHTYAFFENLSIFRMLI